MSNSTHLECQVWGRKQPNHTKPNQSWCKLSFGSIIKFYSTFPLHRFLIWALKCIFVPLNKKKNNQLHFWGPYKAQSMTFLTSPESWRCLLRHIQRAFVLELRQKSYSHFLQNLLEALIFYWDIFVKIWKHPLFALILRIPKW